MKEHSLEETDRQNDNLENSDFVALTSVCQPPLIHSNLTFDKIVINDEKHNMVSSGIPNSFYVNTSLVKSPGGPYDKFKFPSKDGPLTEAGKLEISKIESLEYIVNLLCGKLDLDLKQEWDEIAGRDTSIPEISSNGLQLTKYDIRQQCTNFRKNQEKEKYVNRISGGLNGHMSNDSNKLKKGGSHIIKSHPINVFAAKISPPSEGAFFEFLSSSGYD